MKARRIVESSDEDDEDEGEEEPYVPPDGPPDSTWVHEALEVPDGLWVPNRWLPLYREVENSETWLHSKYTKAFDALRAASSKRESALEEANDASDALRAAEKAVDDAVEAKKQARAAHKAAVKAVGVAKTKRELAHDVFEEQDAEYHMQRNRKDRAFTRWSDYLESARDWTDSLTQDGARATKATERVELEVDDEESAERRVPTPWEEEEREEEEDLFGDNDTDTDNEGGWGGWGLPLPLPPPPPPKRPRPEVVEPESSEEEPDDDDVVMVGERSWKERDDEARRKAVDLTSPRATSSCVDAAFRKFGL